jgi:hypothetical protein
MLSSLQAPDQPLPPETSDHRRHHRLPRYRPRNSYDAVPQTQWQNRSVDHAGTAASKDRLSACPSSPCKSQRCLLHAAIRADAPATHPSHCHHSRCCCCWEVKTQTRRKAQIGRIRLADGADTISQRDGRVLQGILARGCVMECRSAGWGVWAVVTGHG